MTPRFAAIGAHARSARGEVRTRLGEEDDARSEREGGGENGEASRSALGRAWQRAGLSLAGAAIALAASACASAPPREPEPLTADPPVGAPGPGASAATSALERGIAFIKSEKYAEAKPHLEEAVAAQPSRADAHFFLAVAKERTGDRAGAEASYKAALGADPAFAEAAENLAALYLDDPPRPDDAIAVLERGLAKSPDNPRLLQNLAYAFALKGDVAASKKHYERALAKADTPTLRFAYGSMLSEAKLHDEAVVQLKKAMAGFAGDAPTLATIGRMLGYAKAYADCVAAFDGAIQLKPSEPELFVRRGTCRHELGDEPGARADYQAAVQADPKFAAGHYYLGLSLLADKKRPDAIAALKRAASLGEGTPIGKAAQEKLDSLEGGKKK